MFLGNYRLETEIILTVAIDFSFHTTQWFWLGEQLVLLSIQNACSFKSTGKHEAITRYIYAKLLIEKGRILVLMGLRRSKNTLNNKNKINKKNKKVYISNFIINIITH